MNESGIKLSWKSSENPAEINTLLETLAGEYPLSDGGRGLKLHFRKISGQGNLSRVLRSRGEVTIEYTTSSAAARGIGSALAKLDGEERSSFEKMGIMLDCSRNMVMKVEHLKKWLRRLALCGCNEILLYCEDTYELEEEPFFGAYRGGYTLEELQEVDSYAAKLGIEVIGCIQTLAHLQQILRHPHYWDIADSEGTMLVGAEKTRVLVEKMIAFWSTALRSRRIHVGMDEAHGLGRGLYQTLNGPADSFTLMTEHLKMVSALCREHGLAPMIWSDMFFRLTNEQHQYRLEGSFPPGLKKNLDPGTQLVYWEYAAEDPARYRAMIANHRLLGKEPVVASGIWSWLRCWYDHEKTMKTALPCIEACRQEKVKELFFTLWGDDGAYCEYDSALAGIVRCSDFAFGLRDENDSALRYEAICHADYFVQTLPGKIHRENIAPEGTAPFEAYASQLIWDDPLLGIYYDSCKRVNPEFDLEYLDLCDDILCRIMTYAEEDAAGSVAYAVDTVKLLMKKLELRGALEAAYDRGDRLALRELCVTTIPAVLAALDEWNGEFRRIWMERNKPFGLERIQIRNAGVAARLEELAFRLREYLAGEIDSIEELDARLPWSAERESQNYYWRISSGSWIR